MSAMASQITSLTIVYPSVYSGGDQRKHKSSASLAFVREIHHKFYLMPGTIKRNTLAGEQLLSDTSWASLEKKLNISILDMNSKIGYFRLHPNLLGAIESKSLWANGSFSTVVFVVNRSQLSAWGINHIHFLTHLLLDKMATILTDDNVKCIYLNENDRILIRISLKFVPRKPVDNKPALVKIMARHRTSGHYLNQCWPISLTRICGTGGDAVTSPTI